MKKVSLLVLVFTSLLCQALRCQSHSSYQTSQLKDAVIIWQPSHQTDTGIDFSEADVCNSIVKAAMEAKPKLKEYKVWSLGKDNLHHSDRGSNTLLEHTTQVIDGKISGYVYELLQANNKHPEVFISIHNNGGTIRHAIWGYIHYGDKYEQENKQLASRLIQVVCSVTDLQNGGVLLDNSTGRNDYRCAATGELGFYSLDEHVNSAPYRMLLEIGDNAVSRDFLLDPANRQRIGKALKGELIAWLAEKNYK